VFQDQKPNLDLEHHSIFFTTCGTTGESAFDTTTKNASTLRMRMPTSINLKPRPQLLSIKSFALPCLESTASTKNSETPSVVSGGSGVGEGSSVDRLVRFLEGMEHRMNDRFQSLERKVEGINQRLDQIELSSVG
jgi:hypothetical protein